MRNNFPSLGWTEKGVGRGWDLVNLESSLYLFSPNLKSSETASYWLYLSNFSSVPTTMDDLRSSFPLNHCNKLDLISSSLAKPSPGWLLLLWAFSLHLILWLWPLSWNPDLNIQLPLFLRLPSIWKRVRLANFSVAWGAVPIWAFQGVCPGHQKLVSKVRKLRHRWVQRTRAQHSLYINPQWLCQLHRWKTRLREAK